MTFFVILSLLTVFSGKIVDFPMELQLRRCRYVYTIYKYKTIDRGDSHEKRKMDFFIDFGHRHAFGLVRG